MNFENLPANWPTIPLTDPDHIADVLDIFVGPRDRRGGCLLILICDEQRRPVQPVIIHDLDTGDAGDAGGDHLPLARMAQEVADLNPAATVLCAVARPGSTQVTNTDRLWAESLAHAFEGHLELLGVHLITLDGTVPIPAKVDEAA